ncbi:MAG: ribulose-phosphate 3-epimerase [Clostridia bacterium]|nr:ribulose-phosphate 3-epimerase [Clostridia bacterium]
MIKVSPSILAADPLKMGAEVRRMTDAGCDWLHVDIMDAHFVPNLSFGPSLVKALKPVAGVPLDVHLMMDNPGQYIEAFIKNGADIVTIHAEIPEDTEALLKRIRLLGAMAGLSIKPGTAAEVIRPLLPLCDLVLVMTVEPGFGGQSFRADCADKVAALRQMGYKGLIEADGGVSLSNLPMLKEKGLDVAVMGTALYKSEHPKEDIDSVHAL